MVYRIYVEKKQGLDNEARALMNDLRELLGIKGLEKVRLLNRYDCEGLDEDLFNYAVSTVFSEPQLDDTMTEVPEGDYVFAVEYLPGQFDQRAASASECIQLISKGERPLIRSAKVYVLNGKLTEEELEAAKKYVINPVEAREAAMELPETLEIKYDIPTEVDFIENFRFKTDEELQEMIDELGLAMDLGDLKYCREYFLDERREPTITEIRMIDTYWSDHCRHTTFNTIIDNVTFEDDFLQEAYDRYIETRKELNRTKPVSLMDIGTLAAKALKAQGLMDKLDESEEINACTIKMKVEIEGEDEPEDWLLLFKNETHNHPTEIEPFGGAATCIGGAIRDPLSGRSYVYAAMRVTGAGDPLKPVSETIPGKLPQRKLVTTAAAGYSSYGNQIGLATGQVDEIYHPGYVAKRMEVGAVIAAAPAENVIRETPQAGDLVILLGGKRQGRGKWWLPTPQPVSPIAIGLTPGLNPNYSPIPFNVSSFGLIATIMSSLKIVPIIRRSLRGWVAEFFPSGYRLNLVDNERERMLSITRLIVMDLPELALAYPTRRVHCFESCPVFPAEGTIFISWI